jgi:hypothetical protein
VLIDRTEGNAWAGGHRRAGRLADLDLRPAARPRTRHHRGSRPHEILPALTHAAANLRTLGDLGYEGLSDTVTVTYKATENADLTPAKQQFNKEHNSLRAIGERANSLLEMTFRTLRNVSLNPCRIATSSPPPR